MAHIALQMSHVPGVTTARSGPLVTHGTGPRRHGAAIVGSWALDFTHGAMVARGARGAALGPCV